MPFIYQYTGPNLRGAKKEMRKAIDAALKNHRRRFMPRHFTPAAFSLYPVEYLTNNLRSQSTISPQRRAAIKLRFDTTPASQWAELRQEITSEFAQGRSNPNRLLPLVDTGIMRQMVLIQHVQFQGSLDARKMMINVPLYINSPFGITNKRAALEAIRSDEGKVFGQVADKAIQQFANTQTLRR